MVRDTTRIFVHVHPDLHEHPNIDAFALEFDAYKSLAFEYALESDVEGTLASEFLPVLSQEDQESLPRTKLYLVEIGFSKKATTGLPMILFTMSIYLTLMTIVVFGMILKELLSINGGVLVMRH